MQNFQLIFLIFVLFKFLPDEIGSTHALLCDDILIYFTNFSKLGNIFLPAIFVKVEIYAQKA